MLEGTASKEMAKYVVNNKGKIGDLRELQNILPYRRYSRGNTTWHEKQSDTETAGIKIGRDRHENIVGIIRVQLWWQVLYPTRRGTYRSPYHDGCSKDCHVRLVLPLQRAAEGHMSVVPTIEVLCR